tara:strand:- start:1673 stop:1936 length:264 start_codon:yes stop_codon:yes gene_type:complete
VKVVNLTLAPHSVIVGVRVLVVLVTHVESVEELHFMRVVLLAQVAMVMKTPEMEMELLVALVVVRVEPRIINVVLLVMGAATQVTSA